MTNLGTLGTPRIPVPTFLWKMVIHTPTLTGVVFVAANVPTETPPNPILATMKAFTNRCNVPKNCQRANGLGTEKKWWNYDYDYRCCTVGEFVAILQILYGQYNLDLNLNDVNGNVINLKKMVNILDIL